MPTNAEDLEVLDETQPEDQPEGSGDEGAGEKGGSKDKGEKGRGAEKRVRELEERIRELEASERHWSEMARRVGQMQEPYEAEGDEEEEEEQDPDLSDDSPDKLVDEFSTQGLTALVKRGVLTKKEAREIIRREAEKVAREVVGAERQKMTADAKILADFPELKDKGSDLWKRTAERLKEAVALDGPKAAKSAATLYACARAARAELDAEARRKRKRWDDPDDYDDFEGREDEDAEDERERRRRVRQQSGDHGRGGRSGFDDDNGTLGPEAREMIRAMGITEDQYRAFASSGRRSGRRR